jgi:hypothetical protein
MGAWRSSLRAILRKRKESLKLEMDEPVELCEKLNFNFATNRDFIITLRRRNEFTLRRGARIWHSDEIMKTQERRERGKNLEFPQRGLE